MSTEMLGSTKAVFNGEPEPVDPDLIDVPSGLRRGTRVHDAVLGYGTAEDAGGDKATVLWERTGERSLADIKHGLNWDGKQASGTATASEDDLNFGLPIVPLNKLRNEPRPPWLVRALIRQQSTVLLFGETGSYKTFLALDLCASVTLGRDWLGSTMLTSGPVLYVAAEGPETVAERTDTWEKQHDQTIPAANFHVMTAPAQLTDPEAMKTLLQWIDFHRPTVVVFDTFSKSISGADENDNSNINEVLGAVDRIKNQNDGITVVLIHHPGHGDKGRERGASALPMGIDCRLRVEKTSDLYGKVTCLKQKRGKKFDPPIDFKLAEHELPPGEDGEVETSLAVVGVAGVYVAGSAAVAEEDLIRDQKRNIVRAHLTEHDEARERDLAELPDMSISHGGNRRKFFDAMEEDGLIRLVRTEARNVKIWALGTVNNTP